MNIGEFYADYDEDSAAWCVFHTENSFAYVAYASKEQAVEDAKNRNNAANHVLVFDSWHGASCYIDPTRLKAESNRFVSLGKVVATSSGNKYTHYLGTDGQLKVKRA